MKVLPAFESYIVEEEEGSGTEYFTEISMVNYTS